MHRPGDDHTFAGRTTWQQRQLPVETTGFVGRETELARLSALLRQARLVTVTGPGGVGKTRLALRAAATAAPDFVDGVCLVELSGLREPGLLVHTVASALGLPELGHGSLEAVLAYLRDRQLLLILDTCEHLVDASAIFAEAVIAQAPRVTMLATSREPLDVSGENACPVPPLPIPRRQDANSSPGPAVELFIQRASAAVPGFAFTPDVLPDVTRLCRRLDGIPLAIELAAVRLRALPLAELAARLDQRLALLTSGHRGGRHKTLRDAISWSYDLCTPLERTMWACLSVFAGPFSISAAEEVCADVLDPAHVMPTLIRLVDKSVLIRIDPAADDAGQLTQYLMLDTIREFGAEQLAAANAETGARNRFIGRYLAMARYFQAHFLDDDQLSRLRELRREHANARAALEYALGDQAGPVDRTRQAGQDSQAGGSARSADGVELATALYAYWRCRGLAREGSYWLDKAVERAPADSAAQCRALLARGHLLTLQGGFDLAVADASRALDLAAQLGDDGLTARGHVVMNAALNSAGRLTEAAEAGEQASRLLTALGDQLGLIDIDTQLAYLALFNGDIEAALGHVERGLRHLGASRERWLHANLYFQASLTLYLAGRDIESTWAVTRALQVKQEIGDILGTAFALEILGWLAARSGSHQRAAWLLGGADPVWERTEGRLAATPTFERLHAEAVATCEAALGDKRFAELFARGARQPLDEVTAFALNEDSDPTEHGGAKARVHSQLTAREREIATLVAAGLSNRQIAEKLVISRRTVDALLEHIFGKLGITSRVMLTIQLREHSGETDGSDDA